MESKTFPPLFETGKCVATPRALDLIKKGINFSDYIDRHRALDCPDLSDEDRAANMDALTSGDRILSRYEIGSAKDEIYIITEGDRRTTTVLLCEEY